MALTNNKNVLAWVDEMVALTKPDKVVWIDGSKEQLENGGMVNRKQSMASISKEPNL